MEVKEKKLASKVKILTEARVVCEPPWDETRFCRTEEEKAKRLEAWCKEFNEFIRDHRHRDSTNLYVERVMPECCSVCKSEWDVSVQQEDDDHYEKGKTYCNHCGTEVAA